MRSVFAVSFVLLCCTPTGGETTHLKAYSPEKHTVRASRGHKAAMRDGVKLSVDFYRPDGKGRCLAIVMQLCSAKRGKRLVRRQAEDAPTAQRMVRLPNARLVSNDIAPPSALSSPGGRETILRGSGRAGRRWPPLLPALAWGC